MEIKVMRKHVVQLRYGVVVYVADGILAVFSL